MSDAQPAVAEAEVVAPAPAEAEVAAPAPAAEAEVAAPIPAANAGEPPRKRKKRGFSKNTAPDTTQTEPAAEGLPTLTPAQQECLAAAKGYALLQSVEYKNLKFEVSTAVAQSNVPRIMPGQGILPRPGMMMPGMPGGMPMMMMPGGMPMMMPGMMMPGMPFPGGALLPPPGGMPMMPGMLPPTVMTPMGMAPMTPMTPQEMMERQQKAAELRAYGLMSRTYVGSLGYNTTADTVNSFFNAFGAIKSTDLPWDQMTGNHKGYAFVEYECPEAAQLAIDQMNGQLVDGRGIKVGRPNSAPAAAPAVQKMMADPRNAARIYIASIHPELSEADIRNVFGAFSPDEPIKSCKLCPDPTGTGPGKHKGYGFVEYATADAANDAVAAMNKFDLGGQYLRVCKAITLPEYCDFLKEEEPEKDGEPKSDAEKAAASAAQAVAENKGLPTPAAAEAAPTADTADTKKAADDGSSLQEEESMEISGNDARVMMMQKLAQKDNSLNVMVLRNMVTAEEVDEDLKEEVTEQCVGFGEVKNAVIAIEDQTVKVFVVFAALDGAKACIKTMNGRWFGGKQITAELYDSALFEDEDYSG